MDLTEGSETSANHRLTPGKYPKEYIQYLKPFIPPYVLSICADNKNVKSWNSSFEDPHVIKEGMDQNCFGM
jgi:hypothetical protein